SAPDSRPIDGRPVAAAALEPSPQRDLAADNAALVELHRISTDLVSKATFPEFLQAAIDAAVTVTRADLGTLQLFDAATGTLLLGAAFGFDPALLEPFRVVQPDSSFVCSEALRLRARVVVNDVDDKGRLPSAAVAMIMKAAGVCAVQATPIMARDGALLGMLSTHWRAHTTPDEATLIRLDLLTRQVADLLELRRHEEALLRTGAALRAADRRKDEFISMLSHELRNPLLPITTAVELMKRHAGQNQTSELDVIERQARHMARLIDDLMDVTRIAQGRIEIDKRPARMKDVIARAVEMASPLVEKNRHYLDVRIPPAHFCVHGDEARLAQVVANLVTNAAKFTPPGGHIAVRTRLDRRDLVVEVADDGLGIDAALLPHVFDLFIQASQSPDRARGGLGIGLAIARSLIELHGGTVAASSLGPGRGATFTVRLPAAVPARRIAPPAPPPLRRWAGRPRRILFVDDNEDVVATMAEFLGGLGHEVRTAFNGAQALEIAATFISDLAVIDIGLPVMDGYELASRLRAQLGAGAPPLIALSGYGQAADRARGRAAGFAEHLIKPVDGATLLEAIERHCSRGPAPSSPRGRAARSPGRKSRPGSRARARSAGPLDRRAASRRAPGRARGGKPRRTPS
ncbi:MAG TPA: ATP-binding protein, partial [Polyangia bacterium]